MPKPILFLAAFLLFVSGQAQTLQLGVSAGATGLQASVGVSDLQHESLRFSVRLSAGLGGPVALGLNVRSTLSLGPIGNAQLEGGLSADTRARFELYAQGAGTLGDIAASLRLELYNTNPGTFDLAAAYRLEARPGYLSGGDFGLSARGSVSYRLDRFVVLVAEPELHWISSRGLGLRLASALQLRRLVDNDDGHVLLLGELEPGFTAAWAAAGFEYRVNRPDWPLVRGAALLGFGPGGLYPGLRLSVSGSLPGDIGYSLTLSAEPYRSSEPRYRGVLGLTSPLGAGSVSAQLLASSGSAPLGASVRYSYRF